jgi:hypothetical protein
MFLLNKPMSKNLHNPNNSVITIIITIIIIIIMRSSLVIVIALTKCNIFLKSHSSCGDTSSLQQVVNSCAVLMSPPLALYMWWGPRVHSGNAAVRHTNGPYTVVRKRFI